MSKVLIHETNYIAPTASVMGDVTLEEQVSVWPSASIRGVGMKITVGRCSNVQDCAVIHGDKNNDVSIGEYTSLGHGCVVHGCTIGNRCIIGMNAVVLDHAVIGDNSIIGAGAVVSAGTIIPPNSLVVGTPAKVKKTLSDEAAESNLQNAELYLTFAEEAKQAK